MEIRRTFQPDPGRQFRGECICEFTCCWAKYATNTPIVRAVAPRVDPLQRDVGVQDGGGRRVRGNVLTAPARDLGRHTLENRKRPYGRGAVPELGGVEAGDADEDDGCDVPCNHMDWATFFTA